MADTWGRRIRLSIFGESHGPAIGITIDGLPAGIKIDMDAVAAEMARRAPGKSQLSTPRSEADDVEILSGIYNGKTTGSAICGVIRNTNTRSRDYNNIFRPGHADLTAWLKHNGNADMRGGGHFSGRLTAPLVFAGAIAKQVLAKIGIAVHARVCSVGGVVDETIPTTEQWPQIAAKPFAVANDKTGEYMQQLILICREQGDSIGGMVEVAAIGVPSGLGEPFFNSIESVAAHLFFAVPAVKGVEFGAGFNLAKMCGSEANDQICMNDGDITTLTNNCGGILGGITTGQPVIARLAFKPTPSIGKPQQSVNPDTMEAVTLETNGRHDPCIVPRAVPVAEAVLALALLDCMEGFA